MSGVVTVWGLVSAVGGGWYCLSMFDESFVSPLVRAGWEPESGRECLCVVRHVPGPQRIHRHHVWPLGAGGPDRDPSNWVWLCPTSHSDVHDLLTAYDRVAGLPPWGTRRQHNQFVRLVAHTGWLAIARGERVTLAEAARLTGFDGRLPQQGLTA